LGERADRRGHLRACLDILAPLGDDPVCVMGDADWASEPIDVANAARAVACVNACKDIDDPAATLAEVRDVLARLVNRTSRIRTDAKPDGELTLRFNSSDVDAFRSALARLGGGR
jgi:hypothetical protein